MFTKQDDFEKFNENYKFTLNKINENSNRWIFGYETFSTGIVPNNIIQEQLMHIKNDTSKSLFIIWSDFGEYVEHIFNEFGYDVDIRCICTTKHAYPMCVRSMKRYSSNPEDFVIFIEDDIYKNNHLKGIINNKNMGNINKIIAVGNPPYQGGNHQQLYPKVYKWCIDNCDEVCLIFPIGWMDPKNANGLSIMNNTCIKHDCQIVSIDKKHNVFQGVNGAEWTNIIHWKKGYNNGLNGKQMIYTEGETPVCEMLKISVDDIEKPSEIIRLSEIVKNNTNYEFKSMKNEISSLKPYGIRTDFIDNPSKYGLPPIKENKENSDDISIYGLSNRKQVVRFVNKDYPFPTQKNKIDRTYKFKVFIGKAWGNMSNIYGGAYSDIIIASPSEVCTENFLECGYYDDYENVSKFAKYCMSKFARTLLINNKTTQDNSKGKWESVPIQDFTEDFWNSDNIDDIDEGLFEKYEVPEDIRNFIRNNIQTRSIKNIINYNDNKE